jgi:signal transduction histidine kinase
MFSFLFPSFDDKNIQIKHNTLISYALFLFVQTVFTAYSTFNIGTKSLFIGATSISLIVPSLVIYFARKNFRLVSNLFIAFSWSSSALFLLMVYGDNSVIAFLLADVFIISALASLSIRWYIGIIYGLGTILVASMDLVFEKYGILNIFYLAPIPVWIYFIGFSIMLGTMLIIALANAFNFERIFRAYNAEISKRKTAESLLIDQNLVLDEKVKKRTHEIESLNVELNTANGNLYRSNTDLTMANEELFKQREELTATLNKLRITQAHLIQSEKMASLGILSSGIAHEINNPLNFIQGGIMVIENYLSNNNQVNHGEINPLINAINVGVKRASDIVSSLSHFSQHDNGQKFKCDIHSIIENCVVMLQSQLKNKVEIKKQYTGLPYILIGSAGKLHQALLNIISNSEQSIDSAGTIVIRTEVENNLLQISITDSGSGISPEKLPHVFDPFYTTKEPGKGIGLGLFITYTIIKEHNGTIYIDSQSGKGTTVTVNLPISCSV